MNRRAFLRGSAGLVAACPSCLSIAGAHAAEPHGGAGHGDVHWSYEGDSGAERWGELSPEFRSCEIGVQQSPIDLRGSVRAELAPIEIAYQASPATVVDNGHTIQVNTAPGSGIVLDGQAFDLLQFHFHHPSEHRVDGAHHDMELHLVHAAGSALAVLGVFMTAGRENAALAPIWAAMPDAAGGEAGLPALSAEGLLPADRRFFRYYGSLTTPPCSERVTWSVFAQPIEASAAQIDRFAARFPMNARPVRPLNRRFLLDAVLGNGSS